MRAQVMAWNEERIQMPVKYDGEKEAYTFVHPVAVLDMPPSWGVGDGGGSCERALAEVTNEEDKSDAWHHKVRSGVDRRRRGLHCSQGAPGFGYGILGARSTNRRTEWRRLHVGGRERCCSRRKSRRWNGDWQISHQSGNRQSTKA